MTCRINDRHKRTLKPIPITEFSFGPDGQFYVHQSEHTQDFRIAFDDNMVRGEYFDFTQKSIVYPRYHEVIEDIISTCVHETLHKCLADVEYGIDADYGIPMEIHQEHWAIRQVAWAGESIQKEFDYHRNSVIREELEE